MLRESSVPYSSLPQEEGEQNYVTTRKPGEPHTYNKNRLITIIVVLLLICGVPLMVITPIVLSRGSGLSDTSLSLLDIEGVNNEEDALKDKQSAFTNAPTPTSHPAIPNPVVINTTLKPPTIAPAVTTTTSTTTTTTTTPTTTTTTTPTTTTTTTTTTTPAPITTRPIVIIPTASVLLEAGKNQSGATTGTTEMPESQNGNSEGDPGSDNPEDGNNDGFSYTSTQNISNMMNNFMTKHEWWTVVGLAVTAALALAVVIATLTWIIQHRLASRRRKTNLQKVITDLQSRDKAVLLNSEDSEEEA